MKPNQVLDVLKQCKNNYLTLLWNNNIVLPGACGMIIFPSSICFFQRFLWKKLHICAHSRLASVLGLATVCLSSVIANYSMKAVYYFQNSVVFDVLCGKEILASSLLSVGQFVILARTFKVVLPSHLLHPGAYARKGIPLQHRQYFNQSTTSQRRKIQQLGYRNGCHTCGKKYLKIVNDGKRSFVFKFFPSHIKVDYIADHQPPRALTSNHNSNPPSKSFLYPQCRSCSLLQASRVRVANGLLEKDSDAIVTHGLRVKIWKLFVPWLLFIDVNYLLSSVSDFLVDLYNSCKQ